ncbi:MAG TPA: oxygenase MpaB family protein, partial [Amnibacterium sp.]
MSPADLLRARVLEVLSGQAAGVPDWTRALAAGEDAGYFEPDGAVWTVHRDIATLVAGPRALLMQALHPGAMAGVHDWSRYREDPFGRLDGTIRWITTVSFGSTEQARAASAFVSRIHERVRGMYEDAEGRPVPYAASDPDLLTWVHLAFADSFLRTHLLLSAHPIPGGADAYVRDWAIAGDLMGVPHPPRS